MSDETMPVAEAVANEADERFAYELAFHVLPTVAEGEVAAAFDAIKAQITNTGAEIFDEEAPERFDLAYEIVKHIEGKNRRFTSAYFGWARFRVESGKIEALLEELEQDGNILRHLLVKLTKVEEANSFRFHEALADQKTVTTVEESTVVPDFTTVSEEETAEVKTEEKAEETEESADIDESELDKALEKSEA